MKKKKEIVADFIQETFNKKFKTEEVYRHFSSHAISKAFIGKTIGPVGIKKIIEEWVYSFPDFFAKIIKLEEHKNIVTLKGEITAHHGRNYKHNYNDKNIILRNSTFIESIGNISPNNKKLSYFFDGNFIFNNEEIIFCDISGADQIDFFHQLGYFLKEKDYSGECGIQQNLNALRYRLQNLSIPPLTPKEIECICLNLNGLSAKQIGLMMSISFRTVQAHLQHSLSKLGCFNKGQCFELMYKQGYLPLWQDLFNLLLKRYSLSR